MLLAPSLFYSWYSLRCVQLWEQLKEPATQVSGSSILFSIIIPVRNEGKHLQKCLQHLLRQSYPQQQFEIIVVNDHSTDDTVEVVQALLPQNIQLLHLSAYLPANFSGSFKKKALEYGISKSKGDWIVTIDGDTWMDPNWLQSIASIIAHTHAKMVCGPVLYGNVTDSFERFQALDIGGMMLITGAGFAAQKPELCNGANLAIGRVAFDAVDGYAGNAQIASGDDLFLLEKVNQMFPNSVQFAKSRASVVYTNPAKSISAFLAQRLRWGTKTAKLKQKRTLWTLSLLWLNCINLLVVLLLLPFYGTSMLLLASFLWISKAAVDYRLLHRSVAFWQQTVLLRHFVFSEIFHTVLLAVVGLLGLLKTKVKWKERNI